jgi:hypothetical protein
MNCADRRRLACFFTIALVVTASMPTTLWAADDLAIAKIALHLVAGASGPNACDLMPQVRCSDSPWNERFAVEGELETEYLLYVIAVDLNTTAGLAAASFTIEYDAGVAVDGWRSCADNPTYSPDWPASGSHVGLSFTACAGTQPAAGDPEGDGAVVLGFFHVWATSNGRFAIGALDQPTRSAEVRSCGGMTTTLAWQDPSPWGAGHVALGEVAFGGEQVYSTCEFPGIADDMCLAGWSNSTYRCCIPNVGCAGGMAGASPRACTYAGGVWREVRCAISCYDPDCLATPVEPSTWGIIKARY